MSAPQASWILVELSIGREVLYFQTQLLRH
uniref:Uncharacterized protein n=1 Tax=Rhizophora mucronata TaxID=61149 RepID=A0A2P2QTW8_RHIMU